MKYQLTLSGDTLAELFDAVAQLKKTTARRVAEWAEDAPPVAVVAAPPVAVVAAPPVAVVADAFDSRGLAWDARIHSSNKEFKNDGTWRYRRNTPAELITSVEDELSAANPPPVVEVNRFTSETAAPVAVAPAAPPVGPPTTTPDDDGDATITYETVIRALTVALSSGKLAAQDMPALWQRVGVTGAAGLVGPGKEALLAGAMTQIAILG